MVPLIYCSLNMPGWSAGVVQVWSWLSNFNFIQNKFKGRKKILDFTLPSTGKVTQFFFYECIPTCWGMSTKQVLNKIQFYIILRTFFLLFFHSPVLLLWITTRRMALTLNDVTRMTGISMRKCNDIQVETSSCCDYYELQLVCVLQPG